MAKYLPLALATAAIVTTQIACAYYVTHRPTDEMFVDHIGQIVYDGQVIRANLGRAWASEAEPPETETRTVSRLILTKDATLQLHSKLAELLSLVHRSP